VNVVNQHDHGRGASRQLREKRYAVLDIDDHIGSAKDASAKQANRFAVNAELGTDADDLYTGNYVASTGPLVRSAAQRHIMTAFDEPRRDALEIHLGPAALGVESVAPIQQQDLHPATLRDFGR
jgi:hypothetical protein